MRVLHVAIPTLLLCALPRAGTAQDANGAAIFEQRCASCHQDTPDSRAPGPTLLRSRSPEAVLESLVTGAMRPQGSRLSGTERRAVAEFVTGRTLGGEVTGASQGRCSTDIRTAARSQLATFAGDWHGWSPAITNTRFQPAARAGLSAADVSRLRLKWAFGFPDASVAWSQPTVAGDRVFVGSQNGTVYALDAPTGCVHWTFTASGGVRTAVAVAVKDRTPVTVYFGDTAGNAYAVDASSGAAIWVKAVDDHPFARITGSPTLHGGRLYVPVSSYEESQGADPHYPCCTFRGSIVALDASSGRVVWKTLMIPEEPQRRGASTAGVPLWGPAGSAIWSAPTVDARRGRIYAATGNAYSAPAHRSSNAVVALDIETGQVRWTQQVTPDDVYLTGCRSENPNCPDQNGPDHDFGSPPMLATSADGKDTIVIGQKSGVAFGMDPERNGEVMWRYRAGRGGVLGGIEWGAAADGERAYVAVSDLTHPQPGGLHAIRIATGEREWFASPPAPACGTGRGCSAAQSAAVTAIPGVVFSASNDGALRAFSSTNGSILWEFDTNREFTTSNGVPARGASIQGPGPAVAGGMVFVNSGYGAFGGRPGNVLLAFGLE